MKRNEEWILLHLKPRNFQTHLNKNVVGCKHIRFAIHIDFVRLTSHNFLIRALFNNLFLMLAF